MTIPGGIGHFLSWDGGGLFISRATDVTPLHAHYAIQIAFGSETGIRFRASEREPWREYDGVLIPSRQPHSMDASGVPFNAVVFVEPETREGRALTDRLHRLGAGGITALARESFDAAAATLFTVWLEAQNVEAVTAAAQGVVRTLTGGVEPTVVSDERILRVASYVKSHLDEAITLEDLAAVACLSPSRFRHLFVEQTGMGLRPYILWRRFLRVWELLMEGESLSSAAHAAGFADAAHLTRTCRRLFGFPPSAMQMARPVAPVLRVGAERAGRGHPAVAS